jgi:hypothetical protein
MMISGYNTKKTLDTELTRSRWEVALHINNSDGLDSGHALDARFKKCSMRVHASSQSLILILGYMQTAHACLD